MEGCTSTSTNTSTGTYMDTFQRAQEILVAGIENAVE